VTLGPTWTFVAVGFLQASAALPLINAPNVLVARQAKLPPASVRLGAVLYVTHGWFDACSVFVWNMALFVSLGEDYAAYGGALALAGAAAVVGALLLGRHVDRGGGVRAASLAFGFAAVVTLLKSVSLSSPWLAVAANAAGGLVMPLLMPPMAGAVYNLAKSSSCPLRFHVASAGAWDVGCAGGCLVSSALAAAGMPLGLAILFGLPPLAIGAIALRGYFARASAAAAT